MKNALLLSLALTLSICHTAGAAGKITVDPNTQPKVIEPDKSDVHLAQKVTYEARHKAVKTILADLSEMTGVTLKAGVLESDWQVRDRKMNVFAKDITLAGLMNSIARVMKFKWNINEDVTPPTYRLYMDRKALIEPTIESSKAQQSYDKEVTNRRSSFADMIENWDNDISETDLEQLRETNPYLYALHTRGAGAALNGLFKEVPGLKDTFVNRDRNVVSIPVSSLSPETQAQILEAARKRYDLSRVYAGRQGEAPFPEDAENMLSGAHISFNTVYQERTSNPEQHRVFGSVGLELNGRYFAAMHLREPSDPRVKWWAGAEMRADEKKTLIDDLLMQDSEMELAEKVGAESDKAELEIFPKPPPVEHPDEPALHNKIKVKVEQAEEYSLANIQSALAKASGFSVVSDSFRVTYGHAAVTDSETELINVLSAIEDGHNYNWEKHGNTIELSSKDWFKKRTAQIPDEWVEKWRARCKKLGYVAMDDYAQMAMLTPAQLEENLICEEDLMPIVMELYECVPLMRLYASLSPTQRKLVHSPAGLKLDSLAANQTELLRKFFSNPSVDSGDVSAVLKCRITPGKKSPQYPFEIINANDGTQLFEWHIGLPLYVEPPKPNAKPKPTEEKKP